MVVFFLLFLNGTLFSQNQGSSSLPDSIKHIFDTVVHIIRTHSYQAGFIKSRDIKKAYRLSQNAKTIEDLKMPIEFLFEKTGDYHGWFQYDTLFFKWKNTTIKKEPPEAINKAFQQPSRIEAQLISDNIGYVKIRFIKFDTEKMNNQAEAFQKSICSLNSEKLKGFIIDLRLNSGGSMYPMISGVSALLGDGIIGGDENPALKKKQYYSIEKGNLIVPGELSTNLSFICTNLPADMPIAILIGPFTASSGEMTAIAFKGRKNTKFFGEKTAMYTTSTKGFYFGEGKGVVLSISVMMDRKGKMYKYGVEPDEIIIGGDNFFDLRQDAKIRAASNWILNIK